jgi:hypothetical protein
MEGIITKLNAYKSGKGYFVGLDGTDYMFFGATTARIGDKVHFELGKPSKDGTPTIRKIVADGLEAFIDAPAPVFRSHDAPKMDAREEYWKAKEKRDLDNKPTEIRLACLAAACVFYSQQTVMHADVIGLCKRLETYAKEGE